MVYPNCYVLLHNYLDLDPTYKDEYGDPLVRVTYKLTEQEKNIVEFGIEKCHEIMEEMGSDIIDDGEVPEAFNHSFIGGHYTGGVVMGDDPKTSAVNNYMQMWDVDNLFVVGFSVSAIWQSSSDSNHLRFILPRC